ncbi:MAG: nucleotidyltransferase [Desulfuromonadaceae bacterium GWC2_58_13]|nr:MAG: nucleotidyltransferase [Desulfuromonadaceae bacterium GWC2_58_13]
MNDAAKNIRWRQRFQNLDRAFSQLTSAVNRISELSDLEKEGLIQRFEYTFELSWKTLKDYLASNEVDVKFPRDVVKQAFHYDVIKDGEVWMDMLEKRNLIAHTYNEENFKLAVTAIVSSYYPALKQVHDYLQEIK